MVFRTCRVEVKVVTPLKIEARFRAYRGYPGIAIRIQEFFHMQFRGALDIPNRLSRV